MYGPLLHIIYINLIVSIHATVNITVIRNYTKHSRNIGNAIITCNKTSVIYGDKQQWNEVLPMNVVGLSVLSSENLILIIVRPTTFN